MSSPTCTFEDTIGDPDKNMPAGMVERGCVLMDPGLVGPGLALELVKRFPESASKRDDALMALAKTFPRGLDCWETLIYPLLVLFMIALPFLIIIFFIPVVCSSFRWLYSLCWKGATKLAVPPIKHIENKKKEWDEAEKLLYSICGNIDRFSFYAGPHPYYRRPILEAACQNAYKVVEGILDRSPESINSTDKNGYDIIQLAILHRSERVYNIIYDIGEHKNQYRTMVDSSKNNILHLVGRLAPSNVLGQRTGAALQLQRELQWREEVKELVFPTYVTQENIFKETPDMVLTREHKDLVKEENSG
ncbi:uncharacterized protein LOC143585496 [Bidens hawaiensis]|uniref:uncharacterized protein LOC143585496 n=1 Tax=Bidens hawaiensis TaxID=980011 RepID=UPI00404B1FFC